MGRGQAEVVRWWGRERQIDGAGGPGREGPGRGCRACDPDCPGGRPGLEAELGGLCRATAGEQGQGEQTGRV